jgi:serpin B
MGKRHLKVFAISLLVLSISSLIREMCVASSKRSASETDVNAVVAANGRFAFDLYARMKDASAVKEAGGNLFFSPYSISMALAMTYAGARGETERQMAEVLHFTLPQEQLHQAFGELEKQLKQAKGQGYELSVANALWGQRGEKFLEEFLGLTRRYYGAGLQEVDFVKATEDARKTINSWVEKETKNKIKELIKGGVLGRDTVLVLTNAIYFKGDWAIQFDKKNTRNAPFRVSADKKVDVALMHLKEKFKYWTNGDLQILELPYKGEDLSMIVLLPKEVYGLAELEKSLTLENLNDWLLKLQEQEVVVYLPKFKMTSEAELKNILAALGMPAAFSSADFSGITGRRDLFISNVIHKAFVAIDEEGTEAAAATAVVLGRGLMDIPTFRADHPFVFLIRDNRSGSVLFMSRVVNPARQVE